MELMMTDASSAELGPEGQFWSYLPACKLVIATIAIIGPRLDGVRRG